MELGGIVALAMQLVQLPVYTSPAVGPSLAPVLRSPVLLAVEFTLLVGNLRIQLARVGHRVHRAVAVRGLLRGHFAADVGVPLRMRFRALQAYPHGQRPAARVQVAVRQPQPADLGHAQAALPDLHLVGDR